MILKVFRFLFISVWGYTQIWITHPSPPIILTDPLPYFNYLFGWFSDPNIKWICFFFICNVRLLWIVKYMYMYFISFNCHHQNNIQWTVILCILLTVNVSSSFPFHFVDFVCSIWAVRWFVFNAFRVCAFICFILYFTSAKFILRNTNGSECKSRYRSKHIHCIVISANTNENFILLIWPNFGSILAYLHIKSRHFQQSYLTKW